MPKLLRLETDAERKFASWVKGQGYDALKLTTMGWPDRLVVLVYGYCFYIEFKRDVKKFGKREGEKYQNHIHRKLRHRGFNVHLADNLDHAKEIFQTEMEIARIGENLIKRFN